ncbi:MAG: lamin tail domain-containing protein [Ignavibacteria bacterium]|nr:lamin tail domain-containing protein [Ignavibacteria bacterium]
MMVRRMVGAVFLLCTLATTSCPQKVRIYAIDVDQGDATLVVSPSGKALLIDSGGRGKEAAIRSVLTGAGVTRIDHYVTTHYHADHYGGIIGLADGSLTIDMVHDRGDTAFLPASKRMEVTFRDYQHAVGHRAHHLMRGETIHLDSLVMAVCVASGGAVIGEPDAHSTGADENDMSIGLLIQFSGFRFFVGGDIERETEHDISEGKVVTDVDLYQANHHGSESSSSFSLLSDMKPSVVLVSNGDNGTYRHPRQVTLDTLAMLDPPPVVLQTNKLFKGAPGGNVADRFIADLETIDDDGTILVEASLPTRSMTVSYRDTSFSIPWKDGTAPVVSSGTVGILISRLLPDPPGIDRDLEEVTISNEGSGTVDLTPWYLIDEQERVWTLAALGVIAPGEQKTVVRAGMAMSLDNDGDTIRLIDGANQEQDRFTYGPAGEGEVKER